MCQSNQELSAVSHLEGMSADLTAIAGLEASHVAAVQEFEIARMALREGSASPARVAAFEQAQSALAAAESAMDAVETALRASVLEVIVSSVGAGGVAICERMITIRDRRAPEHFKALDLTEAQWETLEIACLKAADEQSLRPEEASILTQCENYPTAILVASRIQTNAPAIQAYFNQFD